MREYRAKETARVQDLDGLALADFWQRAAAFATDVVLAVAALMLVVFLYGIAKWAIETGVDIRQHRAISISGKDEWGRVVIYIVVPVVYFGLFTFFWNGRTPGIERALGYGAAALEFGFGFLQFFIHPYRRTAQDRLAETIVVKEKAYQGKFDGRGLARLPTVVDNTPSAHPSSVEIALQ
jgi:uncharacterized RDD family membrane protein YckC